MAGMSFLPTESLYSKPGSYEQTMGAFASAKAGRLSELEQFYEGLEHEKGYWEIMEGIESEKLDWEKERFGEELAWEKEEFGEKMDWEQSQHEQELTWEKEQFQAEMEFGEEQFTKTFALQEEEQEFVHGVATEKLALEKKMAEQEMRLAEPRPAPSIYTGPGSVGARRMPFTQSAFSR